MEGAYLIYLDHTIRVMEGEGGYLIYLDNTIRVMEEFLIYLDNTFRNIFSFHKKTKGQKCKVHFLKLHI